MSSPAGRVARIGAAALTALAALFLVARAVVELATVDLGRPASYRDDWGGPTYVGVIVVHAGPGVLVLVLGLVWLRRRVIRWTALRRQRSAHPQPVGGRS
jgi:hypothetical protein